jgi:hypothetical protein
LSIRRGHARVLFNEGAFAEDTMRSGPGRGGGAAGGSQSVERDGVEIKALRRGDPEGPDGTRLPSCFKVYLPVPSGKFGMVVLRFVRDGDGLALRYLAFGVRHHPRDSNAQTVYASPTGGFMEGRDSDFDSYENLVPKLVPDSSEPGA